jgi:hypothetical protein
MEQIKEQRHEPGAEGRVGGDDVERDARCVPMEQAADPPVGNDPAGQRLDNADNGIKSFRLR